MSLTEPPHDDTELELLARVVGLTIAPVCRPGVRENWALLRRYAALVEGLPLDDREEPAFEYRP